MRILFYALTAAFIAADIAITLDLHSTDGFIMAFVLNPASIMLVVGCCIGLTLIVLDRFVMVIVPMLGDLFSRNTEDAATGSRHFRLMMKTLRLNAISAGCLGVFLGLLATTHMPHDAISKSPAAAYSASSVALLYGLLLALFMQLLLKIQSMRIKVQQRVSTYMEFSEFLVLAPVLLIAGGILLFSLFKH